MASPAGLRELCQAVPGRRYLRHLMQTCRRETYENDSLSVGSGDSRGDSVCGWPRSPAAFRPLLERSCPASRYTDWDSCETMRVEKGVETPSSSPAHHRPACCTDDETRPKEPSDPSRLCLVIDSQMALATRISLPTVDEWSLLL